MAKIEKISKLIDALKDYAVKSARAYWEGHLTDSDYPPCLASWDALMWYDLAPDWEFIDFLISGTDEAKLLLKSLQSCVQWYIQTEIEEFHSRSKIMCMIN